MAENSKIEWTTHTFNSWRGCTKIAPGCANCYADAMSKRNPKTLGIWGPNGTRVVASESMWREPLKWDRLAKEAGVRHRVFCASLADVFEDWPHQLKMANGQWATRRHHQGRFVDYFGCNLSGGNDALTMDDVRRRLFDLIDATPNLDWLLVTKRPENVRRMWPSADVFDSESEHKAYWSNVWLLTSISDQATADAMIPRLLACRDLVPVYGVSAEPLLGPIRFRDVPGFNLGGSAGQDLLRGFWVIVGGESGHGARPMHPNWARSIRDQCNVAGVPFFFKQWGEFAPLSNHHVKVPSGNYAFTPSGEKVTVHDKRELHIWPATEIDDDDCFSAVRVGKEAAGRLLDGREWNEYPTKASVTA